MEQKPKTETYSMKLCLKRTKTFTLRKEAKGVTCWNAAKETEKKCRPKKKTTHTPHTNKQANFLTARWIKLPAERAP